MSGKAGWTDERIETLKRLWARGDSASIIGRHLNVSRSAVLGKVHRLGLDARKEKKPAPVAETQDVVARAAALWVQGRNRFEIADALETGVSDLNRWMRKHPDLFPKRAVATAQAPWLPKAAAMWKAGERAADIAEAIGLSLREFDYVREIDRTNFPARSKQVSANLRAAREDGERSLPVADDVDECCGVTFVQALIGGTCRFALGPMRAAAGPDMVVCGGETEDGAAFCAHHLGIVYRPRERAAA